MEEYDNVYKSLNEEIALLCKNMSVLKQQRFQNIISKAMSLASFRPENAFDAPPAGKGADNDGGSEEKELYKLLKLKSV